MKTLFPSSIPYPWIIVSILWVSHTVYSLNYMTVGVLAPFIQPDLGLSAAQIGLLCSAIALGCMVIQIPSGVLSDRFGPKWVMALGLLFIGGAAISLSSVHSYMGAFSLLVLLGMGIGCNQAPGTKAIVAWFPSKGRATAMGFKQTGINMGAVLASILLPSIALQFNNWRISFRVAGLASVFSAILLILFYKERQTPSLDSFRPLFSKKGALFGRDFLLVCFAGVFLMASQYSFSTYFLLYATKILDLPITHSGTLLALAFGAGAMARIGWGLVSDYLFGGRRKSVITLIGIIGAMTAFGFILLKFHPLAWLIYSLTILFGLSGIGWNAIYLTMVGEFAGESLAGIATSLSFLISNLGPLIGPPLFGYFIDLTGGYALSWFFVAGCMVVVALLTKIQRKERIEEDVRGPSRLAGLE
ncbi:MAG: hypothetical protein A2W09_02205 [Deltaproteobacteria bacterium RBG_16_50_11]|nr:MAG: hypothetical protein A2W09_02205 [Deltaproteobacteria bacterium RBG_16_50_11]